MKYETYDEETRKILDYLDAMIESDPSCIVDFDPEMMAEIAALVEGVELVKGMDLCDTCDFGKQFNESFVAQRMCVECQNYSNYYSIEDADRERKQQDKLVKLAVNNLINSTNPDAIALREKFDKLAKDLE